MEAKRLFCFIIRSTTIESFKKIGVFVNMHYHPVFNHYVKMKDECRICGKEDHLKHLNLYVRGSEGLDVCHGCEMVLVDFVRGLIQVTTRSKVSVYKKVKSKFEAEEAKQ